MLKKKSAVVLFNLGGPDNLQAVKPFLFNLFNDKAIINLPQPLRFLLAKLISNRRNKKAQKIYSQIGGKSPILETTLSQALQLEKELSFFGDFKTFVAMRYTKPFAKDVIDEIFKYRPDEIILLPLYPQFSSTTSASSLEDFVARFDLAQKKFNTKIIGKFICCYPDDPDFIRSHAILIKQTLSKINHEDFAKLRFLFSAHGLPQKVINAGDPYVFHVEKTTNAIVENLSEILAIKPNEIDFQICFQSKVGPLEWTGPGLDFEVKKTVLANKIPVIIPVSFVSDHSETLVELDIEYKKIAFDLGAKNYFRVPALNLDGQFIKALANMCKKISNDDSTCHSAKNNDRICPKKFKKCPNPNLCNS